MLLNRSEQNGFYLFFPFKAQLNIKFGYYLLVLLIHMSMDMNTSLETGLFFLYELRRDVFSLRTRSFPLKSTKRASSFKLLIFQIVLNYWSFWPVRFYLTRLDLYNKNVGKTVGATSSSGQNTKSAGFRNRLLPRRTRLQSFQLCVTLTASGETITSEHHFTHKLFNKRKKVATLV